MLVARLGLVVAVLLASVWLPASLTAKPGPEPGVSSFASDELSGIDRDLGPDPRSERNSWPGETLCVSSRMEPTVDDRPCSQEAWSEPTRADIERRLAGVRFDFPKVDAAVAVVDRAIPDFFTSARVRHIFLAATPSGKKATPPKVVVRTRSAGREPDGTVHLDALRDPLVRRALRYLGTTGIFAGEPEGPSSPRGKVREPSPKE